MTLAFNASRVKEPVGVHECPSLPFKPEERAAKLVGKRACPSLWSFLLTC